MRVHSVISPGAWRFIAAAGTELGLEPRRIADLLEAGLKHGGEVNRRRLFAALDTLLEVDHLEPAEAAPAPAAQGPTQIQLRSVEARNWSVYRHLRLDLPVFEPERPVILIGGKNGAGKTSLLKALVFGLFGYHSVDDLFADDDRAARKRSGYRRRVESLLHRPSRDEGEQVMSVTLTFDTAAGTVRVERRWFLSPEGQFTDEDEELVVQVGADGDLVEVPPGLEPTAYFQEEITRRLIPPTLAPFLFFDGEQVERLGGRRLEEQLRLGLASLLGASYMRAAAADLRDYARDRIRDAGPVRSGADESVEAEAEELEGQERHLLEHLEGVQAAISITRSRRDEVVTELGRLSGDTYAALQDLLEQQRRTETDAAKLKAAISHFAAEELPILLAGSAVRNRLAEQLEEEESAGALTDDRGASRLVDRFFESLVSDEHSPLREPELASRLRESWERWKAERTAVEVRHHYLYGRTRGAVRARLGDQISKAHDNGRALLGQLARSASESQDLERRINERRGWTNDRERLQGRLQALTEEMEDLDGQRQAYQRSIDRVRSSLEPKRELLRATRAMLEAALPTASRARRANELAELLGQVIDRAAAGYASDLSSALTRTFRELAHKELIGEITVAVDGTVRITDRAGRPIDDLRASAGERHVFAIALLAAIAELGGASLPVVMDTPLGRLDREHRERILQYCMARHSQTILLSHTEEIADRYLAQIDDRVAARFLIEHRSGTDGPGESVLTEGYFATVGSR